MRQWVGIRSARALILGTVTVLAAAAMTAPSAFASETPTSPPSPPPAAGDDASCETRPTTYPADGSPIGADAGCVVLTDGSGDAVGETWTWQDGDSIQWYNYAAVGVPTSDGSVVMCGSTVDTDTTYTCTSNSTYLLFAVSGVFVEWPTTPRDSLHFCQSVTFGTGATAVTGIACDTVAGSSEGEPPRTDQTSSAPPTVAPTEPDDAPTSDLPVEPADPVPDETAPNGPADEPDPSNTAATEGGESGAGSTAAPTVPTPDASAQPTPSMTMRPGDAGSATQTPVASESIAIVGGSRFPMMMVLMLAGGLALGGYATLAGPGLVAARRRRR